MLRPDYAEAIECEEATQLIIPAQQVRSRVSLLRILEAAESVIRNEGIEAFAMGRVAEVAGLSVGGIYRRVKGKTELLQVIKDNAMRRMEDAMSTTFVGREFASFEELTRTLADALVAKVRPDEDLHRILFSTGDSDPVVSARGDDAREATRQIFVDSALALFPNPTAPEAATAAAMAYELIIAAFIRRVRLPRSALAAPPWEVFGDHMAMVGESYLAAASARLARR